MNIRTAAANYSLIYKRELELDRLEQMTHNMATVTADDRGRYANKKTKNNEKYRKD